MHQRFVKSDRSEHLLTETKKSTWLTLKAVCLNFFGDIKAENYQQLGDLLNMYQTMGCNMSLKIQFLHSHLDVFPPNQGAVNEEHGEKFHWDISTTEKRNERKSSQNMLANCCWKLSENASIANYK